MNLSLVMTIGIKDLIESEVIEEIDLMIITERFINNDWGDLCEEDKKFQNELLKNPKSIHCERFMGVYMLNEIKIWIFREYDYSINGLIITILLPSEY